VGVRRLSILKTFNFQGLSEGLRRSFRRSTKVLCKDASRSDLPQDLSKNLVIRPFEEPCSHISLVCFRKEKRGFGLFFLAFAFKKFEAY